MSASSKRALDKVEQLLVDQTEALNGFSHRELTDLAHQLRSRRERIQRMIRHRNRDARLAGKANPDAGAHEKKAALTEAIERVNVVLEERALTRTGPTESGASKPKSKAKAKPKAGAAPKSAPKAKPEAKAETKAAEKPAAKKAAAKKA